MSSEQSGSFNSLNFLQHFDNRWQRLHDLLYEDTQKLYGNKIHFLSQQLPADASYLSSKFENAMIETLRELMQKKKLNRYDLTEIKRSIQQPIQDLNAKIRELNNRESKRWNSLLIKQLCSAFEDDFDMADLNINKFHKEFEIILDSYLQLAKGPQKYPVLEEFLNTKDSYVNFKKTLQRMKPSQRNFEFEKLWTDLHEKTERVKALKNHYTEIDSAQLEVAEMDALLGLYAELHAQMQQDLNEMKRVSATRLKNEQQSFEEQVEQTMRNAEQRLSNLHEIMDSMMQETEQKRKHMEEMMAPSTIRLNKLPDFFVSRNYPKYAKTLQQLNKL